MLNLIPKNRGIFSNSSIKIFLPCLLLSFSFWLSIKLSNKYIEAIWYDVNYVVPYNKVFYEHPKHKLLIKQKSSGYSLLMNKFFNSIFIKLSDVIRSDKQGYYWLPNEQLGVINEGIIDNQFISIFPVKLRLPLIDLVSKKVPIRINVKINCREGFRVKKLSMDDRTIIVTGPINLLKTIKFINTEKWISDPLYFDTHKSLKLKIPEHIKAKFSKLRINIKIEPYT